VTIEAGAVWMQAYEAVTTRAGRYVQGGGCTTVGVAGLIQSGGFGSFSKAYGMAAAALLEAEVVTADGEVRIANACSDPDLFWGLKGGGGGSLGVVTRLTLRTRELPEFIGAVSGEIQARSDRAFRQLIERIIGFYREQLFNPRWGEQIAFTSGNSIRLRMLFHGLDAQQAERTWQPLLDWLERSPDDYAFERPAIVVLPARRLWDPGFLQQYKPGVAIVDERPGVPAGRMYWAGDGGQAGQFLHGYRSAWLPASLLDEHRRPNLADALFAATRYWDVAQHFNKGLAGAPADDIAAARDTAMNPVAIDAFALAIIAGEGPPSYPGISGHEPDLAAARADRREIDHAMDALLKVVPRAGSYVSESDFFESDWQHAFWGSNYPRLAAVKKQYDPDGLFFVHHGVGSEEWSADGFEKRPALGSQVEQI
jgi:FAD/FMN-containing dehydrogenase